MLLKKSAAHTIDQSLPASHAGTIMIHLSPNDLPVGAPLPWSLLDGEVNLVLGSGNVIPDSRYLELVFPHGLLCL